jgi:hypothetical protein
LGSLELVAVSTHEYSSRVAVRRIPTSTTTAIFAIVRMWSFAGPLLEALYRNIQRRGMRKHQLRHTEDQHGWR